MSLGRRPLLLLAATALVLVLAGCTRERPGRGDAAPQILTASPEWQRSVDPETFRARLRQLQDGLERLRAETGSGWIGRQDEVTGYLRELRGGTFPAAGAEEAVTGLLTAFGPDLFGVEAGDIQVRPEGELTENGSRVFRGEQTVGGVPVLDGSVVATVADAETAPRVIALRGRVFPGARVDTEPVLTSVEAVAAAEEASGGTARGTPRLVILPSGEEAVLTWEVVVAGADVGQAFYYVDAVRGAIVSVRQSTIDSHQPLRITFRAVPRPLGQVKGESVEVTGTTPFGEEVTGNALRREDGTIVLVDTTTPIYDPITGLGAIEVHDGTGLTEAQWSSLPGPLIESETTEITDGDALAALVHTRFVLDYYLEEHGRRSWDNEGASFIATVHFGGSQFCNAYFIGTQMIYGAHCVIGGQQQNLSDVDIETVGHEITHGVDDTSSGLAYVDQSGAMDEAFADYFGNVIGNLYLGRDEAMVFDQGCVGLPEPTYVCEQTPEGLAIRYMLNGATMDDYLYLLDPSLGAKAILGLTNDEGGVHFNSAIWNHAMWTIRTRLAQMDGTSMIESPLARSFDDVAYAAFTQGLTASSGFVDARHAIEQAAVEIGADPAILRVAGEVFDQSRICDGCVAPLSTPALGVSTAVAPQKHPVVSGDEVAWLDLAGSRDRLGTAVRAQIDGSPASVSEGVGSLGFAGDRLLTSDITGTVTLSGPAGSERLDTNIGDCLYTGVAGSPEGAAWLDCNASEVSFVAPDGTVTSTGTQTGGFPSAIGTGGGTVAFGTDTGEVFAWRPGEEARLLGRVGAPVASIDAHGDRVVAIAYDVDRSIAESQAKREVVSFDLATGQQTVLSRTASPYGAALGERYAVWAESRGALGGAIAEAAASAGLPEQDTDLYLYSYATGRTYVLVSTRGQQGYPDLSGNRIVWQDASLGGQDVLTGLIPGGL